MIATIWFYDEENYRRFKEICDDGKELPATYAAWLEIATQKMETVRRTQGDIRKIKADPDDFVLWCRANAVPRNNLGRARYATMRATSVSHSAA